MTMRFKKGDYVIIADTETIERVGGGSWVGFNTEMLSMAGQRHRIRVADEANYWYKLEDDPGDWAWVSAMLLDDRQTANTNDLLNILEV